VSEIDYDLIAAHKECAGNRRALLTAEKGACFYCLEEFPSEEIADWVGDNETALCPRCGIDSVLVVKGPSADREFLVRMREYWFERTVSL
jgi:hypothetical protein